MRMCDQEIQCFKMHVYLYMNLNCINIQYIVPHTNMSFFIYMTGLDTYNIREPIEYIWTGQYFLYGSRMLNMDHECKILTYDVGLHTA